MYTTRIAATISECVDERPQLLFDRYVESVETVTFEEFKGYCIARGQDITENAFIELLANSDEYLFTESEKGWSPAKLDELQSELGI